MELICEWCKQIYEDDRNNQYDTILCPLCFRFTKPTAFEEEAND